MGISQSQLTDVSVAMRCKTFPKREGVKQAKQKNNSSI